jgi:hypothetical protein
MKSAVNLNIIALNTKHKNKLDFAVNIVKEFETDKDSQDSMN